ncbi:GroES-like protein [Phlegmacium glaucopus]|nr:GroES-like protein [Phlegmacium glaucopus]
MKALVTSEGNTAVVKDIDLPEPNSKELRIKVHSIAVNPFDAYYVAHPPDKPGRVVGSDIAGTVEKTGEVVCGFRVGDRVAGLLQGATSGNPRPGGFAEYALIEQDVTIRIPSNVSFDQAVTYPVSALTAAQALFTHLELSPPFPCPFSFETPDTELPALLVHSGATAVGLFSISLARTIHTPAGKPFRIFATASPKNHDKLLAMGVEGVFDYRSPTWPEDLKKATNGGISYAVDCISEGTSTARISQAFVDHSRNGSKIAVVHKDGWDKEGVREDVMPLYFSVWSGLGHQLIFNNEKVPGSPSSREFAFQFYKYLSKCHPKDPTTFPIPALPVRLMPGGLERVVPDAFTLFGSEKISGRNPDPNESREWMKPISAEKLVYRIIE